MPKNVATKEEKKRKGSCITPSASLSQNQTRPTGTLTIRPPGCPCPTTSARCRPSTSFPFVSRLYRPRWSLRPHSESWVPSSNEQRTAWDPTLIHGSVPQRSMSGVLPRRRVDLIQQFLQKLTRKGRRDHLAGDLTKKGNQNAQSLSSWSVRENGRTGGKNWNQKGHESVWKTRVQNLKSANVG